MHHSFLAELKKLGSEAHVHATRIILITDWVRHGDGVKSFSFHEHALQDTFLHLARIQAGGAVVCETRYPTHPRHCKTRQPNRRMCALDAVILDRWLELKSSLRAFLSASQPRSQRELYVVLVGYHGASH